MKSTIPRIIWMYWAQGLDNAPEVVKLCAESWKSLNPDYDFRILDSSTIDSYIDLDQSVPNWRQLSVQQGSDLLRLALLERHGGVWVDATLFCLKPLNQWLDCNHPAGVYLVDVPESTDKYFDTFFIASSPGGTFVSKWLALFRHYLLVIPEPMSHQLTKRLLKKIPLLRPKIGRILFTSKLFRQRFGAPYFIVHYLGTRSLVTSPKSLLVWLRRQKTMPGKFSALLRAQDAKAQLVDDLENGRYPFIKLTHKALPDQVDRLKDVVDVLEERLTLR